MIVLKVPPWLIYLNIQKAGAIYKKPTNDYKINESQQETKKKQKKKKIKIKTKLKHFNRKLNEINFVLHNT